MTIEYTILKELELVVSRVYGIFTDEELFNHFTKLASDRRFNPSYSRLTDLRCVTHLAVTPGGLRMAAGELPFSQESMTALVITPVFAKEMASLWGVTATSSNAYYLITENLDDALTWFGMNTKKKIIEAHLGFPFE